MPEKVKKNLLGRTVTKTSGSNNMRQSWKTSKNRDFDKTKRVTRNDDGSTSIVKTKEVDRGFGDNKPGSMRKKRVVTKSIDASGKKTRDVRKFKKVSGPAGDVTTRTLKGNSGKSRSVTSSTQNGNYTSTTTGIGPVSQARTFRREIKKTK
jgi:hypothetical protein